ncbi:MAG: RNA 3'-phosphate cyclase [Gemmataceae bacterium]
MGSKILHIDGSVGEGGGQILRTSLALSALTGQPFHMVHIRAGRAKPGLQPQHVQAVRAAAQICRAQVAGDRLGSIELWFEPGPICAGSYHFAIGTAGATGLVLQTVYLPLCLGGSASSQVVVSGGTHVPGSPCFEFLDVTWRGYLRLLGLDIALKLRRPGFYPRGGGALEAHIEPAQIVRPLRMWLSVDAPSHTHIAGFSAVADLPVAIAERQARRAVNRLRHAGLLAEIAVHTWDNGPGTVLGLVLDTPPVPTLFSALGARGKPAERVADEAVDALLTHWQADPCAVDPWTADQLLVPLGFAVEASCFPVSQVSSHLLTNAEVMRSFLPIRIEITGKEGEPGWVRIDGAADRRTGPRAR